MPFSEPGQDPDQGPRREGMVETGGIETGAGEVTETDLAGETGAGTEEDVLVQMQL